MTKRFALFLTMTAACGGSSAPAQAPAGDQKTSHAEDMHKNLELIETMRSAVQRGDLPAAHESASALDQHLGTTEYSGSWQPHLARVRTATQATATATDLPTAAQNAARAGSACGGCHRAIGVDLPSPGEAPEEESGAPRFDFMTRHQWAAKQMWAGLVHPSDELWTTGAAALADSEKLETKYMTPEMQSIAVALESVTATAQAASSAQERVSAYGEFLSKCAACHDAYYSR